MNKNMSVKDLKDILNDLPDEMTVIIPVADKENISDQVYFSGRDVGVKKVLYGMSKYEEENRGDFI